MNEQHTELTWSTNTSLAVIQDNYLLSIYDFTQTAV